MIQNLDSFPFLLKVQMGQVPGAEIFNRSAQGLINTTAKTMWSINGEYAFQAAASNIYISSDNAGDVGQTFRMRLLDVDHVEHFIEATLNGQNGVLIPGGTYLRGNCLRNISPNDDVTAGDVYLGTEAAPVVGVPALANTLMHVPQNDQRCATTVFTVPADHTAFMLTAHGSVNKAVEGFFEFANRPDGLTRTHELAAGMFETIEFTDQPFWRQEEKSDLWMIGSSQSIAPGDDAQAGYYVLLFDNSYIRTPERTIIT
ncbi:MAG: hypothetical protein KAV87_34000 [Desulfobacteraceae bacterium]|nr:hypothetical protein [Desulfobacteraceae bacterium]